MNKKFLIGVTVFLVLVFVFEWKTPDKFVWRPTYLHTDRQPFGCAVFDSVMSASLPKGYSVTHKTLPQLLHEQKSPRAIIVNGLDFNPTSTDLRAVRRLIERGNKILLITHDYQPNDSTDVFPVKIFSNAIIEIKTVEAGLQDGEIPVDTFFWAEQKPYSNRSFKIFSFLTDGSLMVSNDMTCDTLMRRYRPAETSMNSEYWEPFIVKFDYRGKGECYCVAVPLLFTNYGVLDKEINPVVFRVISQISNLPIVRTEAYLPKPSGGSSSSLAYFLEKEPLRWAVYLALLGLLLFFIFTARRRQRIIPVVKPAENKSLEFVRHIGTLYYQQHDNRDLLEKKFIYFADAIQRLIPVDVSKEESTDHLASFISQRCGLEKESVEGTLREVKKQLHRGKVSDADLKRLIDKMNEIQNQL
ncbi:UNVERIFIED_CONTAM: DUF4350 domain-containing protein [Prevotella sp. 15_C9]